MKKTYIILGLFIAATCSLSAQNTRQSHICFPDMNVYNPADIPIDSSQNYYFSLSGEYKFIDNEKEIWNKPPTFFTNHIGRIKQYNLYYSVSYLNDNYSFFNRNGLSFGLAYQLKWGRSSSISFGGRMIFNFDIVNWNNLVLSEKTGKSLLLCPDLDLGIEYKIKGFTLGVASQNLIGYSTRKDNKNLIKNKRAVSAQASYLFNIGKNFKIAPLAMLYLERKLSYDFGVYFSIYEYVRLSDVFRINELRNITTLDVRVWQNLYLGLAFDFSLAIPDKNMSVMLRYAF